VTHPAQFHLRQLGEYPAQRVGCVGDAAVQPGVAIEGCVGKL
jgi:hypothetical protein